LVQRAFERAGMAGLLDERPGRRGPLKVSPEVLGSLEQRRRERPAASGAELAAELERALGVRLHRRTVERALRGAPR
jgi:transposase